MTRDGIENRERDGLISRPTTDSNDLFIPPIPILTAPAKESEEDARNTTSSSDLPFKTGLQILGYEDLNELGTDLWNDTMNLIIAVESNLDNIKFNSSRKKIMHKHFEKILKMLEE